MDDDDEAFDAVSSYKDERGPSVGIQLSSYSMWRFRVQVGAPPSETSCLGEELKKQQATMRRPPVSNDQSKYHRHKLKYHADPFVAILKTITDA
ncbi:hypothetical protein MMC11_006595 [Xylographa trunciseda]|nr:hypothetical protein [Xylographa trunciseda]